MAISRFFDKTVVISRLRSVAGTDRTGYQATATVDGAIQELDRQARVKVGIIDQRAWMAWFELEEGIEEGDVLTREDDGKQFKVLEATKKDYGINQHLEVVMVEYNA